MKGKKKNQWAGREGWGMGGEGGGGGAEEQME